MVHAVRKWSEQVRELISAVKEGETGRKKSKLMQTTFRRPHTRPLRKNQKTVSATYRIDKAFFVHDQNQADRFTHSPNLKKHKKLA